MANFSGKWKLKDSHLFDDFMADCSEYLVLLSLIQQAPRFVIWKIIPIGKIDVTMMQTKSSNTNRPVGRYNGYFTLINR